MKNITRIVLAIILLIVITVGGGLYGLFFIHKESDYFQDKIDVIKSHINNDNWEAAHSEAESMFKEWEKRKLTWSMVLDHRKMDNMENTIVRSFHYVRFKNKEESLVELNQTAQELMLIEKSEIPTLQNIF